MKPLESQLSPRNLLVHGCGCSEEVADAVMQKWKGELVLSRNQFLIQKGEQANYLWFILEGTLRIYYAHEGAETCVGFGYPGTLICAYPSFVRGSPSRFYIQALKKCHLQGISREDWAGSREEHPDLNACWYKAMEDALIGRIEREAELLSYSPQERLRRLLDRSPHLFQAIPLRHIASYLDMAPETLSRNLKKLDSGQGKGGGEA